MILRISDSWKGDPLLLLFHTAIGIRLCQMNLRGGDAEKPARGGKSCFWNQLLISSDPLWALQRLQQGTRLCRLEEPDLKRGTM